MPINLGIIGTGGIMRGVHLPRIKDMRGVHIAAQCDLNEDAVEAATKDYGGNAYTDVRAMLADEKLDAVLIAVRPGDHGDIEKACARAGLPMFIEKPVALKAADARKLDKVFKEKGVMVSVGYVFRYLDTVQRLRDFLADRKVAIMSVRYHGPLIQREWWFNRAQSGGQTTEQVTHSFDLARYLFGEMKDMEARGYYGIHTNVKGYDIDDATLVTGRFPRGTLASFVYSCVRRAGWTSEMEILGDGFRALWSYTDQRLVLQEDQEKVYPVKNDPFKDELKTFFDAVKSGNPDKIRSPYEDAVKTLALTEEVNRQLIGRLPR